MTPKQEAIKVYLALREVLFDAECTNQVGITAIGMLMTEILEEMSPEGQAFILSGWVKQVGESIRHIKGTRLQ